MPSEERKEASAASRDAYDIETNLLEGDLTPATHSSQVAGQFRVALQL